MNIEKFLKETIALPPQFGVTEDAETKRNELITTSAQYKVATTPTEANSLGEAARDIQTFIRDVESLGLSLRQPLNAASKQIKAVEDDYLAPLRAEKERCERITGNYFAAERRRVAKENRLRQLEIQWLEQARLDAERKANEERERVARENRKAEERARATEAKITNAKQLEAAIKAEAARKEAAEKARLEAEALAEQARKASEAAQAAIRAPLPEVHKVGGVVTRRVMRWEVTDLKALVKARPELCKIEAKPSAIQSTCVPRFLKDSDEVDTTSVQGLKLWWEDDTSTKRWGSGTV